MTRRWPRLGLGRLRRPFELTQEAPCRFRPAARPGRDYLQLRAPHRPRRLWHHLLFQRIAELYAEGLAGEMNPIPFGSLAECWQKRRAASRRQNDAARAFWQEQLQGWPEVKSLARPAHRLPPTFYPREPSAAGGALAIP